MGGARETMEAVETTSSMADDGSRLWMIWMMMMMMIMTV